MPERIPISGSGTRGRRPCLWMSAGVLTYRLCDREYDCEHCPLDAALRGRAPSSRIGFDGRDPDSPSLVFPSDRRYSSGHLWVLRDGEGDRAEGRLTVGIDALAAALIDSFRGVRSPGRDRVLRGEVFAELDLGWGSIALEAPVSGESPVVNPALGDDPELVGLDPYGGGWLVRMIEGTEGTAHGEGLMAAETAREHARMDLRHFRRRVALELLRGSEGVGPTLADGGSQVTDLRAMLGYRRYLDLVRDLVH